MKAFWRSACVSVVAGLCCGCFVLDEFERGDELMEQVSSRGGKNKKAAAAPPAPEPEGSSFGELFESARESAASAWDKATAPAPTEPDPDDGVVRCRIGGVTQYMRASDCQIRGGAAG